MKLIYSFLGHIRAAIHYTADHIRSARFSLRTTKQNMPESGGVGKSKETLGLRWRKTFLDMCERHKCRKLSGEPPSFGQSIIAILKTSRLNLLLVFIPLSWIFHFVKLNNTLIFIFSFIAIIPLAKLLAFATEELSLHLGQTPAELLDITLGNAVELIVVIIALVKCQLTVVQSSLVGSILNKLLLVQGMCFFVGGTRFSEQGFGISAVQLNSSLLTLSVIAVLFPAVFHNAIQPTNGIDPLTDAEEGHDILAISHGVAIILLFIYLCYLVFQLFSHKNLYEDDHPESGVQQTIQYKSNLARMWNIHPEAGPASSPPHEPTDRQDIPWDVGLVETGSTEDQEEKPQMSVLMSIALLVAVALLVAITAGFLVDSIDGLTSTGHIRKGFVGLILLPIAGNAAEHAIAVTASVKNKLTSSLSVAVGSSIQVALFVFPFVVTLAWIMGKPLTLLFDPFESIVLFLSVLTVNYIVQTGKTNWLEGMILICLYLIIAVTFWFYPVSDPAGVLSSCT